MADVEGQGQIPHNPYRHGPPPGRLAKYHPLNIIQRLAYMAATGWVLISHYDAYHAILHAPAIQHEWFKLGLGCTIGTYILRRLASLRWDSHSL